MRLSYVIKFVSDMDRSVAFHRDALGLALRFQSPDWSEFDTGVTRLALHLADGTHLPGSCQLGFSSDDLDRFYADREHRSIEFTMPPSDLHGQQIARFRDPDGAETSVSA